jgi:hypothetical protein
VCVCVRECVCGSVRVYMRVCVGLYARMCVLDMRPLFVYVRVCITYEGVGDSVRSTSSSLNCFPALSTNRTYICNY